ncbi:hypothetical protein BH10ACT11_BH10ACT11_10050 [soil metagenome]
MDGYEVKAIDEMATIHGDAVKLVGAELGVESFGMQIFDFPAGFPHYPEHDHAGDGQEEVYVILTGSAQFEVSGESVSLDPGRMLRVSAGTKRKMTPGPEGVRLLVLGCTPGKIYERAEAFQLS